jgi:hypothetical protein
MIMKFEKRYQLNVELSRNLAATFDWTMDHPQAQSYPLGDIPDGSSSLWVNTAPGWFLSYIYMPDDRVLYLRTNSPHSVPRFHL